MRQHTLPDKDEINIIKLLIFFLGETGPDNSTNLFAIAQPNQNPAQIVTTQQLSSDRSPIYTIAVTVYPDNASAIAAGSNPHPPGATANITIIVDSVKLTWPNFGTTQVSGSICRGIGITVSTGKFI